VSRGGWKLEKALRDFGIDPTGYVCSDSGASTGGFTDCLLQQGAAKVFAIDVGYGQLAWKIRSDPRVVTMERTNIRYVTPEQLGEPLDLSVVDVSFISLKLVLPVIQKLLKPTGQIVCLIKPQFEAGKEKVGKKGVVRDPAVHEEVLNSFLAFGAGAEPHRAKSDFFTGQGAGGEHRVSRASFHAARKRGLPGCPGAGRTGA
jgi:23S rRNA (cytidine1920-2'-O)/16S rRNA (cytidine1409-2'-O)-methyltransferase